MTPLAGRTAPSVGWRVADGIRALPLIVMIVLGVDIVSTVIGQAVGLDGSGRSGLVATGQMLLVAAAVAAVMWRRVVLAVTLSVPVVVLIFTVGPCGEEIWLILVSAVVVAVRATSRQVAVVAGAHLAYAGSFGLAAELRHTGWGLPAGLLYFCTSAAGFGVGLAARRLLLSRDRRRARIEELERENAHIRTVERARLADDLQAVVTQGLTGIGDEVRSLDGRGADAGALQAHLDAIDRHSRFLLTELRALLDVLRRDAPGTTSPPPAVAALPAAGPRRWWVLLTARHVRIAVSAVAVAVAVRAVLGTGRPLDGPAVWVEALGLVAVAVALWRPLPGAITAAAALLLTVLTDPSGYWHAIPAGLLCFLGAYRAGRRGWWVVLLGLTGFGALMAAVDSDDPLGQVIVTGYGGLVVTALGLAARHFADERAVSVQRLVDLAGQRERAESDERSALARELHDVVAHELSLNTMQIMATSTSDEPTVLADTLGKVRRNTALAREELTTLLHTLRGPIGEAAEPTPLVSPRAGADALAHRLADSGYRVDLDIDEAAEQLDPTTQRTLNRIMQEAATNIVRYAPPAAHCHYRLRCEDDGVRLSIESPLAASERASDLSLGYGLRGIRERVDLSGGTFSAGARRGTWVVAVTLPGGPAAVPTGQGLASTRTYEAPADAAVTVSTAGQGPIFLASGWDSPNPSR